MDASLHVEFGARMRAMMAYAGWTETAASVALADRVISKTDRTLRARFVDLDFTEDEVRALSDALAEECKRDGRDGIPAAFLWPPPFPPICQPSAVVDAAMRRQLDSAIRAIQEAQETLPPAKDA